MELKALQERLRSQEERFICDYITELEDEIEACIYEPFSILLSPVGRGHMYTPDFFIKWKRLLPNMPQRKVGNTIYSLWEVKGNFDKNNMTRVARINCKWVYDKFGIDIDIVIPDKLFKKTFVPNTYRYKRGKKSGQFRVEGVDSQTYLNL